MAITWKELGDAWLVEDPHMALGWQAGEDPRPVRPSRAARRLSAHAVGGRGLDRARSASSIPETNRSGAAKLLSSMREKNRLLAAHRPAIDQRIESFLHHTLAMPRSIAA